ncbi:MAG: hypothetical protein FWC68_06560, partial [Oscillospiraceae bacterium]|nr:hypothetical protein [Oscillospiraceae bacterium]
MYFTIFDILVWMMVGFCHLFAAKIIITQKLSLTLRWSIPIFLMSLIFALSTIVSINTIGTTNLNLIAFPLPLILYLYKIENYSLKKAITLTIFSMLFTTSTSELSAM